MFKIKKHSLFQRINISILIFVFAFSSIAPHLVIAASLTSLKDTQTSEKASTAGNHTIVFTTPTGVASGQTIILTFNNSTSTTGVTFTDIDLQDDGVDVTLAAAPTGATWGVVNSSPVITFTNGTTAVAGGSVITIKIGTNATVGGTGVNRITNGSAGTTNLVITGTFTDTGTIGIPIIADDTVVINAIVQPTITFTVSDNTIFFGNLSSSNACFAQGTDPGAVACPTTTETEAFNMTAGTNATSGYIITVQGPTLTSGGNTILALGSATASSPGSEQFGLRFNASGGSGTVTAPYGTAGQYAYTGTATTPAQVASYTGPSATTTYSGRYIANISSATEAGTYTASHTYVATATY